MEAKALLDHKGWTKSRSKSFWSPGWNSRGGRQRQPVLLASRRVSIKQYQTMAQLSESGTEPQTSTNFSLSGFCPRLCKCSGTMALTSSVSFCNATCYSARLCDTYRDFLWPDGHDLCLHGAHSSRGNQESLTTWCSACTDEVGVHRCPALSENMQAL